MADVVAPSEMDGDEAVEGASQIGGKDIFSVAGLEKGKVACDRGLDEGGPGKVGKNRGGGEGIE